MFKNLNIHQIAIYVSLIFCAINISFLLCIDYFFELNLPIWTFIILLISSVVISFFSIRIILEKYLLQKIKLIYKVISSSKIDYQKNNGKVLGKETTFESIDEEVAQWAEHKQNEILTLRSLEEYRKNYVGNISHELKTPLFSVQGFIHTLLDGGIYDKNINIKYLKRAASNLDRLNMIVEDLETIDKFEKDTLQQERFDLRQLFEEVFRELETTAKSHQIEITFKDKLKTPVFALGDSISIYRVITNLLVNSLKYGKKGGTTRVSFYDLGENILTEVSDDGIGIEEKHLKHLFDRFYRVDPSRSRKIGGSGLGLSIVKHIIEAHDQSVNVRSTPGIGSTFGFTLKKG